MARPFEVGWSSAFQLPRPARQIVFMRTRNLKVEPTGDFHAEAPKPAIRLKGRWLERAGFPPNSRVNVILRSHGVLEIQARAA